MFPHPTAIADASQQLLDIASMFDRHGRSQVPMIPHQNRLHFVMAFERPHHDQDPIRTHFLA